MTSSAAWSVATFVVSTIGILLGSINPKLNWLWGVVLAQPTWVLGGYLTGRPGDISLSAVFVVTYLINFYGRRKTQCMWVPKSRVPELRAILACPPSGTD